MAKLNSPIKNLNRLFDRIVSPVYVVSPDYVLTYVNPACHGWTNVVNTELLGTRLSYTSHQLENPTEDSVQGLCPPPEVFQDDEPDIHSAKVFIYQNEQIRWRAASMHRVCDDQGSPLGVIVFCQDSDLELEAPDADSSGDSDEIKQLLRELRSKKTQQHRLESLVGVSPFSNRLRRQVSAAIGSTSDLLITGPPGSGKEHLARTVHSQRAGTSANDLMTIHCSIADQELVQNSIKEILEPRGSYRIDEQVNQTCVLLLDVDQLEPAVQNELLGFFQLPNFPVTVFSTANQSLVKLASSSRYSTELAKLLGTISIEAIPLEERKEDIPLLAQLLLEYGNENRKKQLSGFSNDVLNLLCEYHWPENLDQLRRTIDVAGNSASGSVIVQSDLPEDFHNAIKAMRIGQQSAMPFSLDEYLTKIEKELIERALVQARGNKTQAAKSLDISRAKMIRRIQSLEISLQVELEAPNEPLVNQEVDFEELDS